MMDSKVSARIPLEERQRGDQVLAALGATTSDLIRAAYCYLLETGTLPQVSPARGLCKGKLSAKQKRQMQDVLRSTTCKVPAEYFAGKTDDELLEEELRCAYEALT